MYFEKVSIYLQGDLSFPLPPLHRVLQEFDHSHLSAPEIGGFDPRRTLFFKNRKPVRKNHRNHRGKQKNTKS